MSIPQIAVIASMLYCSTPVRWSMWCRTHCATVRAGVSRVGAGVDAVHLQRSSRAVGFDHRLERRSLFQWSKVSCGLPALMLVEDARKRWFRRCVYVAGSTPNGLRTFDKPFDTVKTLPR
jgi:hypothetical protein